MGLGLGLLLSLFVIAALVSLVQARIVGGKVREITEMEEPTSKDSAVIPKPNPRWDLHKRTMAKAG